MNNFAYRQFPATINPMHKILYIVVAVLGVIIIALGSILVFKSKTQKETIPEAQVENFAPPTAQVPVATPPPPAPEPTPAVPAPALTTPTNLKNNMHTITIKTTLGDIAFETYDADAPKAAANFVSLAEKGFYNNVIFHRVIPGFMIQGGDPTGTGRGGPGYAFEDELNPTTESYKTGYKKGVVAMANSGPNTNGSQFFIMLADYPLPNQYTIFGKVISGQGVVDKIGSLPKDSNDRPLDPPKILSVSVVAK